MNTLVYQSVMNEIIKRINLLMLDDNIESKTALAKKIARSKPTVTENMRSDESVTEVFVNRLQAKLGWSASWILTGRGPKKITVMPEGNTDKQILNSWAQANEHPVTTEPVSPYNARHKGTSDKLNMWWVPAKAEAGFIRGFAARLFPSMIQRGSMPMIQGECFAFEIDGFSMYPEFLPGTYVLCTTLEDAGWLRKGRSYVFQTAEGLIIKYFDRIEDNMIYTTAANNNFNPVAPIPVEDIQQLYNIEFSMNRPKPQ